MMSWFESGSPIDHHQKPGFDSTNGRAREAYRRCKMGERRSNTRHPTKGRKADRHDPGRHIAGKREKCATKLK